MINNNNIILKLLNKYQKSFKLDTKDVYYLLGV